MGAQVSLRKILRLTRKRKRKSLELSDEEKDHVLELIESGELDIKDVDPRDLPSRERVTPTAFNSFDLATRPIQNAFNIDGVTNAGRGVIDAQMAFLDALTRPLLLLETDLSM